MATNKRDLKAYVRFDGTGRIVPGSLVLRRSKPKNGNWKEIQTYECCNPVLNVGYSFQPEEGQITLNRRFNIYCNIESNTIFLLKISDAYWGYNLPQDAVNYLNSTFSWVGTWSWFVDPNDPELIVVNVAISQPLLDVLNLACPGGTIGYVSTSS